MVEDDSVIAQPVQDPRSACAAPPHPSIVAGKPGSRGRPGAAADSVSLAPREHGAYGQLAVPAVTAFAMGRPTLAACALALAAVLVFLAHEPALVVLGRRGSRASRHAARAQRFVVGLGIGALAAGALGLWLSPPARTLTLLPLALALALAVAVVRGVEKTLWGEILAASALSGAALPIALASGVGATTALLAWSAWCVSFAAVTWAVRLVVAHKRAPIHAARRLAPLFGPALLVATGLGVAGAARWSAAAALPAVVVALVVASAPPDPRKLRRVGWALVATSIVTAAVLAIGAHAAGT